MSTNENVDPIGPSPGGLRGGRVFETAEYRFRGKSHRVPMMRIEGREIVSVGKVLRMAMINDEEWRHGSAVDDPARFVKALREARFPADVFTFSGNLDGHPVPGAGRTEPDNAAVIRVDEFAAWWESLPQSSRKNTRRAIRMGVVVRNVRFDDRLVSQIKSIYDELPVRQGRSFWHFGKPFEVVKLENSTYLDKSDFIGAYLGETLIGFAKIVYVDRVARIMQILCMEAHQDKRTVYALVLHAAERARDKGAKYLVYSKYTYGNKVDDSVSEFKRRLGFERLSFPRYFVPVTTRGDLLLQLGAHKGLLGIIPDGLASRLRGFRSWWLTRTGWSAALGAKVDESNV
jgi:hypothetical protein